MYLFKNARIVDAHQDNNLDLLVNEGGKIHAIGKNFQESGLKKIYNLKNKLLMPAFIDLHAHFRDPGYLEKESLETGALAALSGGYGVVNLMANTKPTCSTREVYEDIISRSKELGSIHIEQVMTVTKDLRGEELVDFDKLPDSLKFFSEDGKGVASSGLMLEAMRRIHDKALGLMIHAEDASISDQDYRMAEDLMTYRDAYLSWKTGCRTHFSHVSTKESLDIIRDFKKKGAPITCEVTPHHMYRVDPDYRVNPPIRAARDIQGIFEHIKRGTVDAIATDHAPHTREDKRQGAPGMIGLETAFFIVYQVLAREEGFSLNRVSELMSCNPAKILGLNKGLLYPGYDADFTIVDLSKTTRIEPSYLKSKSINTPFLNEEFQGSIEKVFISGQLKFERSSL